MVRTKEIARIFHWRHVPPRKEAHNLLRTVTKAQTQKLLAPKPKAAFKPRKAASQAAPKVAIQPPKPVVEAPRKRPGRMAVFKSLKTLSKQKASKTPSKQAATKTPPTQAATKTPSKQAVTEATSNEIDISISITCQHCKKRQKLDTEVIELCKREGKRKEERQSKEPSRRVHRSF